MGMTLENVTYGEFAEKLGKPFDTVRVRLRRDMQISAKRKERVPQQIADFLLEKYGASVVQTMPLADTTPVTIEQAPELPAAMDTVIETPKSTSFWAKIDAFIKALTYADAIIFITCAATTYGLVTLFSIMGFGLSILYWLVSFWVLSMVKDQNRTGTAQMGVGFMWVLSFASIYVHVSMFNNEIWAQADKMLFRPQAGDTAPFWTALVLGVLVFAVEIFAFVSKRSETLETAD